MSRERRADSALSQQLSADCRAGYLNRFHKYQYDYDSGDCEYSAAILLIFLYDSEARFPETVF